MKKGAIVAAAVIALLGAGAAALPLAQKYVADRIKAEIERGGVISVSAVEVGLLDRRVTLHDLRAKQMTGVSASRWEASGVAWPLDELLHGRSPLSGFRLGDPLQAGRLELDDLRITAPTGQSWAFGSIVAEGFDLARFDANVVPGPFQFGALSARIVAALALRHFEEHDVVYTIPGTQDAAGFALLAGDGLDRGELESFSLVNFEATARAATEPSFVLGSVKGERLDLRQVLAAMAEPSWRPGMSLGRLHVDRASATGFGGSFPKRYGISLGSITTETTHDGSDVSRSTTRVDGFVLVPPARGLQGLQMRVAMQAMGLKELKLGLECAGAEDRAKGELSVDSCALTGADLGQLDFSAKLIHADAIFWRAVDSGGVSGIYGTRAALGSAKLVLADKGLVERSIRALSAATAQNAAVTRANLAAEIRRYQPPNVLITDDMTKLLDTTARFIEHGGTLTVEAAPDPPFGLDKVRFLAQPGPDLINLLGLSASLAR